MHKLTSAFILIIYIYTHTTLHLLESKKQKIPTKHELTRILLYPYLIT